MDSTIAHIKVWGLGALGHAPGGRGASLKSTESLQMSGPINSESPNPECLGLWV